MYESHITLRAWAHPHWNFDTACVHLYAAECLCTVVKFCGQAGAGARVTHCDRCKKGADGLTLKLMNISQNFRDILTCFNQRLNLTKKFKIPRNSTNPQRVLKSPDFLLLGNYSTRLGTLAKRTEFS